MFDTHETTYHLDSDNKIVWVHCHKIKDEVLWIQSGNTIEGFIGNPWVFALSEATENDISRILEELTTTYSGRILRWLDKQTEQIQRAA